MNHNHIVIFFFGLLIPVFSCPTSVEVRIKELENAAYSKLLELRKLGQEIKELQSKNMFFALDGIEDGLSPYIMNELCCRIEQKLKEKGITVSKDDLFALVVKQEERKSITTHKKLIRDTLKEMKKSDQAAQEIKALSNEAVKLTLSITNALLSKETTECNVHEILFDETLFDDKEDPYKLNMFKFSCIQSIVEINLLQYLVDRYQSCLTELIDINNELRTLKRKENK